MVEHLSDREDTSNDLDSSIDAERLFDRKKIRNGILLFAILTISALTILFLKTGTTETLRAFRHFDLRYVALVICLSFLDMWLGSLRNHIFVRKIKPGISFWVSFRANLANIFLGAITPSQSGGGPAQLFVYHRAGITVGQSLAVSILNYLSTLIYFVATAGAAFVLLRDMLTSLLMKGLVAFCFVVFLVQLSLLIFLILKPSMFISLLSRFSAWLERKIPKISGKINRTTVHVIKEIEAYQATCMLFFRKHKLTIALSPVITVILYTNKFILAYVIMLALGVGGSFVHVLAIQAIILFVLYFSPSPGGSGIAEISIAALMSYLMPEGILGVFVLLQRFFLLYVPAIIGAVFIVRELHSLSRRKPRKRTVHALEKSYPEDSTG
jgi:uncharacterized protein (TIRG00374 family)